MKIKAKDLRVGDLVDLENDRFADPDHKNVAFQYLYSEVCEIHHETPECVAIGFNGFGLVGFPREHLLEVERSNP